MTFKAYIDNITAKTGKSADELRAMADARGFSVGGRLKPDVKAGAVVEWLKTDLDLGHGHGHAMAVVALLKGKTS